MNALTKGGVGLGLAVLAGLVGPAVAAGQQRRIEVAAYAGGFLPVEDEGLERAIRDATRRRSLAWGGRITFWATNAVGIELTGGYSPARILVEGIRCTCPRSTDALYGSGKVAVNLTPGSTGLGVVLSGGVAGLRFDKTVVDPDSTLERIGGVAGAGLRLPLWGALLLRGDVEDYIYRADFGVGKKTNHDLVLSGGLTLAF
jgi:hypothetical protein